MKRKIIILSLLVSMLPATDAHVFIDIEWYKVDSLLEILPMQTGNERVQTLNRLAASLSFEDAQKGTHFADEAMAMAKRMNYTEGIAETYRNYARIQFYEGNYPEALHFFYEALHLFEELGNLNKVAAMYMEIATTHFWSNNIEKAIEIGENFVIPAYRAKDAAGNPVGGFYDTLRTFSKLGLPYRMTGRSDTALRIYQRYLKAGREHGFEITDLMVHEALVAGCFIETGNADSAKYHFWKALAYPEVNQSVMALKHEYMRRLASVYTIYGEPDSAYYYYSRAYNWLEQQGYIRSAFLAAWELGMFYNTTGQKAYTENNWLKAERLLNEMISKSSYYRYDSLKYTVSYGTELFFPFSKKKVKENLYEYAVILYKNLYRHYFDKNELSPSMNFLLAYSAARDTLDKLSRNREAVEIQTRFETRRKDAEILSLSQANELNELRIMQYLWLIGGLAALAIIVVLFAFILRRQHILKNSRQTLMLQQRLLRSQINPHFIFNSLSSIQNAIINQEPEKASKYLTRFSKLVRNILDSSVEESITLEDEISNIENYLALQRIRFPNKFDYNITVDEHLDTEKVSIPPMLAQPFVENAIEHGIKHKVGKGHIAVRFTLQHGKFLFEIEDDGIGRQKAQELMMQRDKDHKSMATAITLDRIAVLNKKLKRKITLEIIDLENENGEARGTRVVFGVPV